MKKLLKILLSVMMAFTVIVIIAKPVKAQTHIDAIYIYVTEPYVGEKPDYDNSIISSPYHDGIRDATLIAWYESDDNKFRNAHEMDSEDTFKADKFYHIKYGSLSYQDPDVVIDSNTKIYINMVETDGKTMRFYTGKKLTRIYGDNRYFTSMAIADVMQREWQPASEVPLGLDEVFLTSADNFADALAVSYAAFNAGEQQPRPIIVVNEAKQDIVEEYIRENFRTSAKIWIIGGTKAVPEKIEKKLAKDYEVKRIAGNNRYDTNLKILETFGVSKYDSLLIATGTNFADSLSASATGIPMLLVGNSLNDDQKMFLQRNAGKWIYILGGTGAVSETVEKQIKDIIGGSPARISGANRYETSELIAREFFQGCSGVAIAYGKNFPDGLCGGPLAGRMNAPLLLVDEDHYSNARKFVKDFHVDWGYAFGGTGVISDTLFKKVLREQGICPIYIEKHE